MNKRLYIKNLHKTAGLNILGVSIDNWTVHEQYYEYQAYYEGISWTLRLMREAFTLIESTVYVLELITADTNSCRPRTFLTADELKVKRLFFLQTKCAIDNYLRNK